jgi:hypothetical protein
MQTIRLIAMMVGKEINKSDLKKKIILIEGIPMENTMERGI